MIKTNIARIGVCLSLILLALCPSRTIAAELTPVRITITNTLLRPAIPHIGFNICQNPLDDKSTLLQNCLNSNPGLESSVLYRRMFIISAGDDRTFEEPAAGDQEYQKLVPETFWIGADFRVLEGKAAGRKGKVTACTYTGKTKTLFTADSDGPTFSAGDLIWLSQPNGNGFVDTRQDATSTLVALDDRAPFHGGKSCIKLDAKTFKFDLWKVMHVWLPTFKHWGGGRSDNRESNADRFMQEKSYRISLWAKGAPGTKVSVRFVASSEPGGPQPDDFTITDTWKKYELIRKSEAMVNLCIVISGGDLAYIDNFIISEDDGGQPLAILPRVADALADLKPGTLRLLGGARGESLDNWLAHPLERRRTLDYSPRFRNTTYRDPDQPNLPDGLNLCERSGASPWLVMGLAMTDDEWDSLLEYLGGPPESPYGAKRAQQGQKEPWLKTFDKIYLELGDEVWNNSRSPWTVQDPARYAAWAQRVFTRVKKNKYYSEKIRLVANGHTGDTKWINAVLNGCTSLDILSHSAAIPAAQPNAPRNAEISAMQTRLLNYPLAQSLPQLNSMTQLAKAAGKVAALSACETVSSEQSFLGPERSLLRSPSAAVAVLDELLLELATGSEAIQFSNFAQGSDNATHVDAHTLALHPAAQAIRLFNLHAAGMDLVTSTFDTAPPPLASYAFKSKTSYSVLLLNRSPNTAYSATLALPAASQKLRCYRIAAESPLAGNLNEMQAKTEEFEADAAAGIIVPAHSIVLAETAEAAK